MAGLPRGACTAQDLQTAQGPRGEIRGADDPASGTVTVALVRRGSNPCSEALVSQSGQGLAGLDVAGLDLDPATARVVDLGEGSAELLRVDSASHPRGGFQPHLFVVGPDGPAELTEDGHPLLGFVATDGGAAPTTARCAGEGQISVVSAFTSEPPGVVRAWDVKATTYDVVGPQAVRSGSGLVEEHVADPTLRRRMPDLFAPAALFTDCSHPLGD